MITKFRCRRLKTHEIVAYEVIHDNTWMVSHDDKFQKWSRGTWWIDCIREQFTGLLDKNGKEIYSGDIVEWDDGSEGKWRRRCEIKWDKTKYVLVGYYYNANIADSPKTHIDFKFGAFIYEYDGALEIIGNTLSNPDLISSSK